MRNLMVSLLGGAVAMMLCAPPALRGQAISDPDHAALTGSAVIDFSSVSVGNYTSFTVADVIFSSAVWGKTIRVAPHGEGGVFNHSGNHLQNNSGNTWSLRFEFLNPLRAFGFQYGAANADWNLYVYDASNSLLGSALLSAASGLNGFIGFEDAAGRISHATFTAPSSDWLQMDNFEYVSAPTVTPEPVSMALLGTGLAGLGAVRRRRKREDLA